MSESPKFFQYETEHNGHVILVTYRPSVGRYFLKIDGLPFKIENRHHSFATSDEAISAAKERIEPPAPEPIVEKKVISARLYDMLTGETTPAENKIATFFYRNLDLLPEDIKEKLLHTDAPVEELIRDLIATLKKDRQEALSPQMEELARVLKSTSPDAISEWMQKNNCP
jgi:hypothetical protein